MAFLFGDIPSCKLLGGALGAFADPPESSVTEPVDINKSGGNPNRICIHQKRFQLESFQGTLEVGCANTIAFASQPWSISKFQALQEGNSRNRAGDVTVMPIRLDRSYPLVMTHMAIDN